MSNDMVGAGRMIRPTGRLAIAANDGLRRLRPALPVAMMIVLFSVAPGIWAWDQVEHGYRSDFQYPSGTGGNSEVTGEKPESKAWWNDGSWWASVWSNDGAAYHIFRLDLDNHTWIDTGVELDDRKDSRADVLWDGSKLYVVSHILAVNNGAPAPAGQRGELYRYIYHAGTGAYTLDPQFPVEVTGGKSETLVLEKASNGQLWVTYVEDDQVMVNHSTGEDWQWAEPFALDFPEASVDSDDISSIISFNQHIGVMWSNQDGSASMYFAVRSVNSDEKTGWSRVLAYDFSGDDHINLKSLEADSDGNVYAAIKSSRNAELIVLLVCERNANFCRTEDDWASHVVYNSNTYNPTRPFLLIDTSNRELYIFTRNVLDGDQAIYYKKTSIDDIQFNPDSAGEPFIRSATETRINDPTSTKQNVNSATGLLVLASDSSARRYFYNYVPLPGSIPQYELAVNIAGSGDVTMDPPGGVYDDGQQVTLTAVPHAGWQFSGWSGDVSGADNPVHITMDGAKTITATFTETPPVQVSLTVGVHGEGTVALDPPGGLYAEGSQVQLTATPAGSWTFAGWSGDLTGSANPASITMDGDKEITATFEEAPVAQYTLAVDTAGSGSVTLDPPGGLYAEGQAVTLTAGPQPGWRFDSWSGDFTGADNPAQILMDGNKNVLATFIQDDAAIEMQSYLPIAFGGGLPDATLLVENPYKRLNADQLISVSVPVRRFAVRR